MPSSLGRNMSDLQQADDVCGPLGEHENSKFINVLPNKTETGRVNGGFREARRKNGPARRSQSKQAPTERWK
jgi:hypothetical protein